MNNTLPNSFFEDYPIEFKQINPSDFIDPYNVSEKVIITPDGNGYISDALMPYLEEGYDVQNTVVINAGVGQGKSKSIMDIAATYAIDDNYIVVVAVPFNNLIEQYVVDFSKLIDETLIFNIQELPLINLDEIYTNNDKGIFEVSDEDMIPKEFDAGDFKIHIMTTNALLGNGGEWTASQSEKRLKYFDKLVSSVKKRKKLVIIFDEIHDSIYNFKEQNIFNLWKFHGMVHKVITLSATYNEASKEVIRYLSDLTEKNIQIIESKRVRIPEKQSRLHLNFYSGYSIDKDERLERLVNDLVVTNKTFDIMVYSKTLTKKLIKKPSESSKSISVANILDSVKDRVNRCYADPLNIDANRSYDHNKLKINIGTNFTTGVNITADDHNLIVILPSDSRIKFASYRGIFTSGINAIVQSLARQRKQGDIYVFLPFPSKINTDFFPHTNKQKEILKDIWSKLVQDTSLSFTYTDINKEGLTLSEEYQKLADSVSEGIRNVNLMSETERLGANRLEFPTKEIFILDKGEKILAKYFFNGDLSGYFLWASITNQFLNCKLETLDISDILPLSSENLKEQISDIYYSELNLFASLWKFPEDGELEFSHNLSAFEIKEYFEDYFFKNFRIILDGKKVTQADTTKLYKILTELIFDRSFDNSKELQKQYFKSCVYFASCADLNNGTLTSRLTENQVQIIQVYKDWWKMIQLLDTKKVESRKKFRLPNTVIPEFVGLFNELDFENKLKVLLDEDWVVSRSVVPFKDTFKKQNSKDQRVNSFYSLLLKTFFDAKLKPTKVANIPVNVYELDNLYFESAELVNLLYKPLPEIIL